MKPSKNGAWQRLSCRLCYNNMKYNNVIEYSNAIAGMFDWNYTTFIRTYRYITSSVAAKWGQKIANRRNVKAVYVSVERDAEKMNHLHLAIASTPSANLKKRIASAVNIRENSIGNIEPIKGKNETIQYISKQLTRQNRYIDAYHDLFINSKTRIWNLMTRLRFL